MSKVRYIEKEIDWKWVLDYDNDYSYPCDGGCKNDYCRCGVVGSLNYVTIDLPAMIDHIVSKIDNVTDIEKYCIGRILTSYKVWETDNWSIESSWGYYGQEVDGLSFENDYAIRESINSMLTYSDPLDKIKFVLELEYANIDPVEGMTSAEVIEVDYSTLKTPNSKYAGMVKRSEVDFVKLDDDLAIGVYKWDGDFCSLIDGYHRFAKAGIENKETVKIVVLS